MDATLEEAEPGQVVIFGFGRVGRLVADMMEAHGKDYLAIDSDVDSVRTCPEAKAMTCLFGDVSRPELIERLKRRGSRARSS